MSVGHLAEPVTQEPRSLHEALGFHDPRLARVLGSFGFDAASADLITWLPAVELAWINGLSPTERRRLLENIQARHPSLSARGHALLAEWLRRQPSQALCRTARRVLRAQLAALPPDERPAVRARVIGPCVDLAEASGGLLGISAVSRTEQTWLEALAHSLRGPDDASRAANGGTS